MFEFLNKVEQAMHLVNRVVENVKQQQCIMYKIKSTLEKILGLKISGSLRQSMYQ